MQDFIYKNDLELRDGDLLIGASDNQHTEHILIADKGQYKGVPEIGVGITNMLNDETVTEFLIDAKKNLQYDGQTVQDILFTEDGQLEVKSHY